MDALALRTGGRRSEAFAGASSREVSGAQTVEKCNKLKRFRLTFGLDGVPLNGQGKMRLESYQAWYASTSFVGRSRVYLVGRYMCRMVTRLEGYYCRIITWLYRTEATPWRAFCSAIACSSCSNAIRDRVRKQGWVCVTASSCMRASTRLLTLCEARTVCCCYCW